MARFKRGKWWWTDFSVNGVRYRQSLRTTDWREAQAQEKELISQASQGKLAPSSQRFARLAFAEAADRYVESRRIELAPRSIQKERELLRAPIQYFGTTALNRLSADDLQAYREKRAALGKAAVYINMEMGAIRRVLKRAKRWHLLAGDIKPLKEKHRSARVLSPEEKLRLLRKAASRPEWQAAQLAMELALNTTMRSCEIRSMCWCDVDFIERTLTVRRSKTEAGERIIPLNVDAWTVLLELWERARVYGGTDANHFVFPACENGRNDPTKPQKSWRTAWRHLTREAGLPGLRFHDLRHHAITELAESQTSDQTIMSIAGHVSPRMLAHYSHVRLDAKRKALEAISSRNLRGYGTKRVTNGHADDKLNPQVIEKFGGPGLTRTTDLTLIRGAL